VSEHSVVHFTYADDQKVEPRHRWGKGYVVRDAVTSTGRSEVDVDRGKLLARALQRRNSAASKRQSQPL
jgi:hypothetical protein